MKTQPPITAEDEHRVLEFRPRASAHPPAQRASSGEQVSGGHASVGRASVGRVSSGAAFSGEALGKQSHGGQSSHGGQILSGRTFGSHAQPKDDWQEANDLARYERDRDQPDNFRHRILANLAAFAFTVALTAVGLWLAISIADLRRTQDCVLMGRRDCVRISVPNI